MIMMMVTVTMWDDFKYNNLTKVLSLMEANGGGHQRDPTKETRAGGCVECAAQSMTGFRGV